MNFQPPSRFHTYVNPLGPSMNTVSDASAFASAAALGIAWNAAARSGESAREARWYFQPVPGTWVRRTALPAASSTSIVTGAVDVACRSPARGCASATTCGFVTLVSASACGAAYANGALAANAMPASAAESARWVLMATVASFRQGWLHRRRDGAFCEDPSDRQDATVGARLLPIAYRFPTV